MRNILLILVFVGSLMLVGCNSETGYEYMPDMGHSIAQEANVYTYYYYNTWDEASTVRLRKLQEHNLPVKNTIARGYSGAHVRDSLGHIVQGHRVKSGITVPKNGFVPYYYSDTEEGRTKATEELIYNPFPITEKGLNEGKDLYDLYCGICHGEKGDGNGWLVDESNPNAVYPNAPANFLLDDFVNASNGRYYHAIVYGKNVMGSYSEKLDYEERWQVIHYIRSLQAKEKKLVYGIEGNTLNPEFGSLTKFVKKEIKDIFIDESIEVEHESDHGSHH